MDRSLPCLAFLSAVSIASTPPAGAVDRIVLEIREIDSAPADVGDAKITVELDESGKASAHATADRVAVRNTAMPRTWSDYRAITLACGALIVKEPRLACREGRLDARGEALGTVSVRSSVELDSASGRLSIDAARLALAGGRVSLDGTLEQKTWKFSSRAESLELAKLVQLASPWITLPAGYSADARIAFDAHVTGTTRGIDARFDVHATEAAFTNEEGSYVGEKLDARLTGVARRDAQGELVIDARLDGLGGQALAGPALLDFGANPLTLTARGSLAHDILNLSQIAIAQRGLLDGTATARLRLGGQARIEHARIDVGTLQFPAAYSSFLQLALATTDFGTLKTTGRASAVIEIANDTVVRADGVIDELDLDDTRGKFAMKDVRGELHWRPDTRIPSYLSWSGGSAYGLSGGAARIDFAADGEGVELLRETRLPVFDGAINVRSLAIGHLGAPDLELRFDATIEPISMSMLSKAFGWPELSGQLSGSIPGLSYRNKELTLDGDLVAQVFDGTIVGSGFRLIDPLGPWPRLFADVSARSLDLSLVTRTFSVGSITGRLDASLDGLELFDWSPVAFDARLYSTPGDRSERRISQKAITRISSVGGGGGGVAAALQSGVLRFFDDFKYEQIGLTCRLQNDVCLMGGIAPAATGYYIVKGRGLPRIDIIGNAGRVDWPQLMSQIVTGMHSEGPVVR